MMCLPSTNLAIVIVQTYSMPIFHCPWLCRFPVCFNLFVLLFLVTPCLIVAVQPCMERIPIKKNWFLNFFPPFFLFSFIFLLNICTSSSHSSSVLFLMFLSVHHLSTCSIVSSSISHNGHNGYSSSFL